MSAGLAASTLTPGRIAPDVSLTMPATAGWENAGDERRSSAVMTKQPVASGRIKPPGHFELKEYGGVAAGSLCQARGPSKAWRDSKSVVGRDPQSGPGYEPD